MEVPGILVTLAGTNRLEEEIKKSRFIAVCAPAESPEEAMAFLESVREVKATHNCWAYRIGDQYRFSDDGEPGGTAGRPILAAIEGQGLDHVMVVVIRYYGGIKLGAGGLVRAYGNTAAECLRTAPRKEVRPTVTVTVPTPFDLIGTLYPLIERLGIERLGEEYRTDGVALRLRMDATLLESFLTELRNTTRGRVEAQIEE
jgi:uncharacterized YigZ family protein